MRALIQRVSHASVTIDGELTGKISNGLLVLMAVEDADTDADIAWLSGKIARMRIFEDEAGLMNKSVMDVDGEVMVVSQFTLFGDARKGNRPSFIRSSKPVFAEPMYNKFVAAMAKEIGKPVPTGRFGADMKVELLNNGPVTIWLDSKE